MAFPTLSTLRNGRGLTSTQRAALAAAVIAVSLLVIGGASWLGGKWAEASVLLTIALGCALLLGALVRLRLWVRGPLVSCLVLPLAVAMAQLGPLAALVSLPLVLFAGWLRGLRGAGLLAAQARQSLALAVAAVLSLMAPRDLPGALLPPLGYAAALGAADLFWPPKLEGVARTLVLAALVPLAWLPLAVQSGAGDGAMLLVLAAQLMLLVISVEAGNLAVTRLELQAERDQLAAQNKLLDDLINLLAHDIRNPLTAIMGAVSLGRRALGPNASEAQLHHLDLIEAGAHVLDDLAGRFVQLARLEETDGLVPVQPVAVPPLMAEVLSAHLPQAQQRQLTLTCEVAPNVPAVLASEPLLREALANLVSNALKYTPEGGRVTLWARPGLDETIELGVTDTGIGLRPEELDRLFTRFFRSGDERVRQTKGHGLGLALTRGMVERMDGRIQVASKLDEGSTFTVELRRAA